MISIAAHAHCACMGRLLDVRKIEQQVRITDLDHPGELLEG